MAVLSLNDFNAIMRVNNYTLSLTENLARNTDGAGVTHVTALGPRLWHGEIVMSAYTKETGRQVQVLAQKIQDAGNYFLFSPPDAILPQRHTGGSLANVKVAGTATIGYSLNLNGLPANYPLTVGDYLSIATNGIHRLYQLTSSVTASAAGTATVTINTPITAATIPAANAVVRLQAPIITVQYAPGTFQATRFNLDHAEGISFGFVQAVKIT